MIPQAMRSPHCRCRRSLPGRPGRLPCTDFQRRRPARAEVVRIRVDGHCPADQVLRVTRSVVNVAEVAPSLLTSSGGRLPRVRRGTPHGGLLRPPLQLDTPDGAVGSAKNWTVRTGVPSAGYDGQIVQLPPTRICSTNPPMCGRLHRRRWRSQCRRGSPPRLDALAMGVGAVGRRRSQRLPECRTGKGRQNSRPATAVA